MPRIAYLNTFSNPNLGGGEEHLLTLIKGAQERHFEVHCFVSTGSQLKEAVEMLGVKAIEVNFSLRNIVDAIKKVSSSLSSNQMDILHTHGFLGNIIGRLAARRALTRIVVSTVHCQPDAKYEIKKSIKNGIDQILRNTADNFTAKYTHKIIAVSLDIKNRLVRQGIDENKIVVIYNGISVNSQTDNIVQNETHDFNPVDRPSYDALKIRTQYGIGKDNPVIGTIARLEQVKNLVSLLVAFKALNDEKARLLIVGDGPERPKLEAAAKNLQIDSQTIFTGYQNQIDEFLRAFDVFIITSLSEGLNLTLLRAQAIGVPVIASQVGGNPEVIKDGDNGFLFPPQNVIALHTSMQKLLSDRSLRKKFALRGREKFLSEFNATKMIKNTFDLYQSLLETDKK